MDETKPGEFNNDPYADDDHLWGYNGYTANRLDDQFFLGKDILVAPIVNPGTCSVSYRMEFHSSAYVQAETLIREIKLDVTWS